MLPITITAPPSKSLSHRSLIAAALAKGTSHLTRVLESDDTARTREALAALGAVFVRNGEGAYEVTGLSGLIRSCTDAGGKTCGTPLSIFVGESGTTCRLLTAVLAAGKGLFRLHGAGRMHQRPVSDLADALIRLGTGIVYEGTPGCPPLVIEANGFSLPASGSVEIGADDSSQYLSGLLMAAPAGLDNEAKPLRIHLGGRKIVSWPYVSLTLQTMDTFGIRFTVEILHSKGSGEVWESMDWRGLAKSGDRAEPGRLRFNVWPGVYQAGTVEVEGDWSGASYFFAAGAVGRKPVRVRGLNMDSLQADAALLDIMRAMGARMERYGDGATIFPSALRGINVDMGHCPDLVPTVAALAAKAHGVTVISNVAHLKIKESDRLAAPAAELRKVGCSVTVTDSGLAITPPEAGLKQPGHGEIFSAHNDHRMAMSVSILGLPGSDGAQGFPVPLDNPDCVNKSFPSFWTLWAKLLE